MGPPACSRGYPEVNSSPPGPDRGGRSRREQGTSTVSALLDHLQRSDRSALTALASHLLVAQAADQGIELLPEIDA